MARRKKGWSYNAGERGKNWVRAYEDRPGKFYLEWFEEITDEATGQTSRRKRRALLRDVGTAREARERADDAAEKFGEIEEPVPAPLTLARLLALYTKEVTPTKGTSKQDHDRRAARIFTHLFGEREPRTLDRRDWDRFIQARRAGTIQGFGPVRDRQVEYDLKFLIAVLTWATGAGEDGEPYLEANPWGAERRRAQKWPMPKEISPTRPAMTDELRAGLVRHAPSWQLGLALALGRATVSRNSSVRTLQWSDLDLVGGTVRWRGEYDKVGREAVVPLPPEAIAALRRAPSRAPGARWVFPSETDSDQPTPRDTFQVWMRRAKARWLASIGDEAERERLAERLKGLGYHGEKRAGVRDPWFRGLDPKMQEKLSRTNHRTLIDVYDDVTLDEMRAAMARRKLA
jgi:integrase